LEDFFDYIASLQATFSGGGAGGSGGGNGQSAGIPMQGVTAAMQGYGGSSSTGSGNGGGSGGIGGGSGGHRHWLVTHSGGGRSAPQPGVRFNEREYKQATFTRAAALQVGINMENRRVGQESGGTDWYSDVGKYNWFFSATATGLSNTEGSFRLSTT